MSRAPLAVLLLASPLCAQPLATVRLELDVRLDVEAETIAGTARIAVKNAGTVPVRAVPILLNRLMTVRAARTADGRPIRVDQSVVVFEDQPKRQVNAARLAMSPPLEPGETRALDVDWGGYLVGYTETGSLYVQDRVSPEFTLLREDAYAFPVVGEPSWAAARAAPRPGFTFDVRVTVPKGLVVAAGGASMGTTARGDAVTHRFASDTAVPFVNIAIAPYDVTERDGITLYAFREDAAGARRLLERAGAALKLLESWLGPPPSAPRLTVFEIPEGWGSQAHLVAGVMQTASAFRDAARLEEVYHELSHLWNPADLEAPSPRWNEGLATYLQRVVADELDGGSRTEEAKRRVAARVLERAAASRLDAVPLARYGDERMTDHSYTVGFLWLATLERVASREKLLAALREVLQRHMKTGLSTRDLTSGLEERLGPMARTVDARFVTSCAWVADLHAAGGVDALAERYAKEARSAERPAQ